MSKRKERTRLFETTLKEYGAIISRIVAGRGLTMVDMAKEIAVDYQDLAKVIAGTRVPSSQMAERIKLWCLENVCFTKSPSLSVRARTFSTKPSHVKHSFTLTTDLSFALEKISLELGVSSSTVVQIALERLLSHDSVIKSYKEAMTRVEKALVAELFERIPSMQEIFECDEDYAINMGRGKKVDAVKAKVHEAPFAVQQVLETKLTPEGYPYCETYDIYKETEEL